MDFLFSDADKNQFWKAFTTPRPELHSAYIHQPQPVLKLAQATPPDLCDGGIDDTECTVTGDKPKEQRTIGAATGALNTQGDGTYNFDPVARHELDHAIATISEEQQCKQEQKDEAERDAQAEDIADEIRGRHNQEGNPNNVELGAFILRIKNADGTFSIVRVNSLSSGTTGAVSLRAMLRQAQREFPGIDGSNVVGAVHLHPSGPPGSPPIFDTDGNLTDLDYGNLLPSHPNIAVNPNNDWAGLQNFLQNNGRTDTCLLYTSPSPRDRG